MKTATNQVAGAIVMGVGMGLLEQTVYDPRNGDPINDSFADYLVATSADVPDIDVTFLNIPDPMMGSFGARESAKSVSPAWLPRLQRRYTTPPEFAFASCLCASKIF